MITDTAQLINQSQHSLFLLVLAFKDSPAKIPSVDMSHALSSHELAAILPIYTAELPFSAVAEALNHWDVKGITAISPR